MTARKKYVRTIDAAFESLTLDGKRLDYVQAYAHFDKLSQKRKPDEGWKRDLFWLVFHLTIEHGKSIAALTSGTTGPPKRITIPRRDLVNSARLTADTFDLREGDRVLLCLPCEYIAGKMMVVRAMALGLDLHVIDPRGSVLDNLKSNNDRYRFTAMVPLQLHRAIQEDHARVERQFDTILLGGGPVSAALEEDLQHLKTAVFQGYGSTETVTHVALRKLNGKERSDRYTALGRVTFATDERGCLVVRTPHLKTKEHVTNDLVDVIDGTHFRWLGRIDNVILSGGKKIYPEQLEARSGGLIGVPHFFLAMPDDQLGVAVALALETDIPPEELVPDILESLTRVLEKHEWPRRILATKQFRRTASGKLIRQL